MSYTKNIPRFTFAEDRLGRAIYGNYRKGGNPAVFGAWAQGIDTFTEQLPCRGLTDQAGMVNTRVKRVAPVKDTMGMTAQPVPGRLMNFGLNYTDKQVANAMNPILRQPSNFNAAFKSKFK